MTRFVSLDKTNSIMITREYILTTLRLNKHRLERLGVRNVGLFGSFLRNEQTTDSDIDILLDFEPDKENFDNFMEACDLFEEVFSNAKVEIVTRNGLSPYIGPKILNEVVYV